MTADQPETTADSYNEAAARRYAVAEARPDSFANAMAPRVLRLLDQSRLGSLRALDVGAGTGQLVDVFRAAGLDTVALDMSQPMLERRSQGLSATPGNAVVADAAHIPLKGSFDLVTATFNVLNHLPDRDAVRATVEEISRLLSPNGLFIFDINTRMGLEQTESLTMIQDSTEAFTHWRRHWLSEDVLRLVASGAFSDGENWHQYTEVIDKIVLPVSWLGQTLVDAGLGNVSWVANDLVTLLDDPEQHSVAFCLVRANETGV